MKTKALTFDQSLAVGNMIDFMLEENLDCTHDACCRLFRLWESQDEDAIEWLGLKEIEEILDTFDHIE